MTKQVCEGLTASGTHVATVDTGGGTAGSPPAQLFARLSVMGRGLWSLLVRRDAPAVYVGGAGGLTLWYQALVILLARWRGLRTVFHHHSYAYINRSLPAMRFLVWAGGSKLTHVVLCPGMGRGLRRRYPGVGELKTCSNAGLMRSASPPADRTSPHDRIVMGHLSNLSVDKGLLEVIGTLRLARSRGMDVELLLGGPSGTSQAAAIVNEALAEFGDALTYLGRVGGEEIDEFYGGIDVFLFPSRYVHEAEPLVVLDASRNGVPTVAYDVGCLSGMCPDPARVVPTDGDFPSAAVAFIRRLQAAAGPETTCGEVRTHFERRRLEAVESHEDLLAHLSGAGG